jgi:hypothetical protein
MATTRRDLAMMDKASESAMGCGNRARLDGENFAGIEEFT